MVLELISNPPSKGKKGRPPGSTKVDPTPEQLIKNELLRQLALFTRLREIVERRLDTRHESELGTEDLSGLMDLLLKGITQMAKVVVAPQKSTSEPRIDEEEDPQKILEGLIK